MDNQKKILIIDDAIENIDMINALLGKEYELSVATSGTNALKVFQVKTPDLILLDIILPDINGYELLKQIKNDEKLCQIPVIFVTARDEDEYEAKGLALGAVDYIPKPFSPAVLKARIKTHLLLREKTQQLEKTVSFQEAEILNAKVNNLLNNIDQGVLSFKASDLLIEEGYSKKSLELLQKETLYKEAIDEVLFATHPKERHLFNKGFKLIRQSKDNNTVEIYLSLLPQEILYNNRHLKIAYKFLENDKFMVTLEDITQTKELEDIINEQEKTQKMIVAIAANKDEFLELKSDFEKFHKNIFEKSICEDEGIWLLRTLHTFKGLFAQKEMNRIVDTIHDLESKLKDYFAQNICEEQGIFKIVSGANLLSDFSKDLANVTKILGDNYFEEVDKHYRTFALKVLEEKLNLLLEQNVIIDRNVLNNILFDVMQLSVIPLYTQFISYPSLVQKTAERLNKKINPMEIDGDNSLLVPTYFKNLTKTLIHVYRNCVDHGIEDPDTRVILYKEEAGNITTSFKKEEGNIIIEISDDGSGINIEKISKKAIMHGIYTYEEITQLSEKEKLELIFHDNISTKDVASQISGRGLGLSAVKEEVSQLNGRLEIDNRPLHGVTFRFIIPFEDTSNGQKEFEILMQKVLEYFKDSIFLTIDKIESLKEYTPSNKCVQVTFKGDLNSRCLLDIDSKLQEHLISIMIPAGVSKEDIELMKADIPKEILNTFSGLAINDLNKIGYNSIELSVPSMIDKGEYDTIVQNALTTTFIRVDTDHGSFICAYLG